MGHQKKKKLTGRREQLKSNKPQGFNLLSFQKALQRYNAGLFQEAEALLVSHLHEERMQMKRLGVIDARADSLLPHVLHKLVTVEVGIIAGLARHIGLGLFFHGGKVV